MIEKLFNTNELIALKELVVVENSFVLHFQY